jgi:hypothetical protein
MEVSKGIYDLLSIAEELERSRPGEFKFHFLGDGSELSSFRNSVSDLNSGENGHRSRILQAGSDPGDHEPRACVCRANAVDAHGWLRDDLC